MQRSITDTIVRPWTPPPFLRKRPKRRKASLWYCSGSCARGGGLPTAQSAADWAQRLCPFIYISIYRHTYMSIYVYQDQACASRAQMLSELHYGIVIRDYIKEFYYGIILRDNITEFYFGIILRDNIMELYDGIILRDNITGLHYGTILRDNITELYYGIRLWNDIT